MEAFIKGRGKLAFLDRANIDTDQIIPKQFLKSIKRTGFGEALFFDWRCLPDGTPDPSFVLNQEPWKDASILVVRNNFGCGSSREHAVWAVLQAGFRVVIAPGISRNGQKIPAFADIFAGNAVKNGLLTVELAEAEVEELFRAGAREPGLEAEVDLAAQKVRLLGAGGKTYSFAADPSVKEHLLEGLDDIGLTMKRDAAISSYERKREAFQEPAAR